MQEVYIRECNKYKFSDLKSKFKIYDDDKLLNLLNSFRNHGIIKTLVHKNTDLNTLEDDLLDELSSIDINTDSIYVFVYVGILKISDYVVICYPKYYTETPLQEDMKQILKVLDKYNSQEQEIKIYDENIENGSFNLLAIMIYLLQDYFNYGLYSNEEDILETNGLGEIQWNKTINDTFALIQNNKPYYLELKTKKHQIDESDYFRKLHAYIITKCSHDIGNVLSYLLDIPEVTLTSASLGDFGDIDYILYKINNELNIQFNTRKILLLKTIYTFLIQEKYKDSQNCFNMYGTTSFNIVWEKVCANVFNNQLNKKLSELNLSYIPNDYNKNQTLLSIIEKPVWNLTKYNDEIVADGTLIPDIVNVKQQDDTLYFTILDAKYYVITSNGTKIFNAPGIKDITKQYLYQLAYRKFTESFNNSQFINCFLVPTEGGSFNNLGHVSFSILHDLNLSNIKIFEIPTKIVFQEYIKNSHIDFNAISTLFPVKVRDN